MDRKPYVYHLKLNPSFDFNMISIDTCSYPKTMSNIQSQPETETLHQTPKSNTPTPATSVRYLTHHITPKTQPTLKSECSPANRSSSGEKWDKQAPARITAQWGPAKVRWIPAGPGSHGEAGAEQYAQIQAQCVMMCEGRERRCRGPRGPGVWFSAFGLGCYRCG